MKKLSTAFILISFFVSTIGHSQSLRNIIINGDSIKLAKFIEKGIKPKSEKVKKSLRLAIIVEKYNLAKMLISAGVGDDEAFIRAFANCREDVTSFYLDNIDFYQGEIKIGNSYFGNCLNAQSIHIDDFSKTLKSPDGRHEISIKILDGGGYSLYERSFNIGPRHIGFDANNKLVYWGYDKIIKIGFSNDSQFVYVLGYYDPVISQSEGLFGIQQVKVDPNFGYFFFLCTL